MRVEFTRRVANPRLTARPGQVVDLPEAEALRRIQAGHCRPVDVPRQRLLDRLTGGRRDRAEDVPLDRRNVAQLRAYAAEHGIDLGDAGKKVDILAAIEAAQTADE